MNWQPYVQVQHRPVFTQTVSTELKTWLSDTGSLTERLIARSRGEFRVKVLQQRWGRARLNEARVLGINPRQRVLIREVVLHGNNLPWVYARSILPATSLQGSLRHLKVLGAKPWGAILFNTPSMKRGKINVAYLNADELPVKSSQNENIWGRRSVFYLDNKPLLVSEVFLPEFISMIDGKWQLN